MAFFEKKWGIDHQIDEDGGICWAVVELISEDNQGAGIFDASF